MTKQDYTFERYRKGRKMAEGAKVSAENENEARALVGKLFPEKVCLDDEFRLVNKNSTSQLLRLTYAEMFFIGAFLDMVVNEHPEGKEPIRMQLGRSARKKIWDALEQADRDGIIDRAKLEQDIIVK